MSAYRCAVVIPTRNRAALLSQALQSSTSCGVSELQIIVVDDGSTDDTPDVAQGVPGVTYLRRTGMGPSAARNVGMEAVRAPYVIFLDDDDCLVAGAHQRMIAYLDAHADVAVAFGDVVETSATGRQRLMKQSHMRAVYTARSELDGPWRRFERADMLHMLLLGHNPIRMGALVLRCAALDAQPPFDDGLLCEDLDLWVRLAHDWHFACLDEVSCIIRKHEGNISRDFGRMAHSYEMILSRTLDAPRALPAILRRAVSLRRVRVAMRQGAMGRARAFAVQHLQTWRCDVVALLYYALTWVPPAVLEALRELKRRCR